MTDLKFAYAPRFQGFVPGGVLMTAKVLGGGSLVLTFGASDDDAEEADVGFVYSGYVIVPCQGTEGEDAAERTESSI